MRLFVAVDLDAAARTSIVAEQQRLRASMSGGSPLRWVKPEHLHLTLVFLGEIHGSQTNAVLTAYAEPASIAPFDVVFRGIGAFPDRGSPRALWIGIGQGECELMQLQDMMAERAHAIKLPLEARPFSPHLTIGRWKESRSSDRRRLTDATGAQVLARMHVARATLYESQLGPNGPTYVPRAHVTLTERR